MKLEVSYKQINSEFSQQYADNYNDGFESPKNPKYHHEAKYGIDDVKTISQIKDAKLEISGIDSSNVVQTILIDNVFHLKCELTNGDFEDFLVSNELIEKIHFTQSKNIARFYFYLKDKEDFILINKTTYIKPENYPFEKINKEWIKLSLPNKVKSKDLFSKRQIIVQNLNHDN
ncbi:MAG: hypothetical protein RQ875_11860 [Vicingaceae bacterium]|nr:hypothetical protein [Vicingaceae bacterium]